MTALQRPVSAMILALALFAIAAFGGRLLPATVPGWLPHAVTKGLMVLFAVIGMRLAGGGADRWGFVRARDPRWGMAIVRGALLGAAATALLLLFGGGGVPMVHRLGGPLGIILHVWIVSSICEEIFVRGWFHGWLSRGPRVVQGALLFAAMHLSLIVAGADAVTVIIIVAAAFVLGLFAGADRERSGSLGPPIATHIAFNAGGMVAGIIITIIRMRGGR